MELSKKVSQIQEHILNAEIETSSLPTLKKWYELLCTLKGSRGMFLTKQEIDILGESTFVYITAAINCATECETSQIGSKVIQTLMKILPIIAAIKEIRDEFIKRVTARVIEMISSDPSIKPWCGKQILQTLNMCLINSNKQVRQDIISQDNMFYLYKLVDMLSVCGDYEYQEAIMEIIFRMCSPQQIEKYTSALFPEDKQLQQTFLRITRNNFESDIRLFLNRINSKSLKIFTILSRAILFNDKKLPLLQNLDGFWVDFNVVPHTVSFYCSRGCVRMSEIDDDDIWERVTLTPEIVSCVKTKINGNMLEIYFNLTEHADSKLLQFSKVTFLIEYSDRAKTLKERILPKIFEEKILESDTFPSSQEESEIVRAGPSKGATIPLYKALKVHVSQSHKKSVKSAISSNSSLKSLSDILLGRAASEKKISHCGVSSSTAKEDKEVDNEVPSTSHWKQEVAEIAGFPSETDQDWFSVNSASPVACNLKQINTKVSESISAEFFTADAVPATLRESEETPDIFERARQESNFGEAKIEKLKVIESVGQESNSGEAKKMQEKLRVVESVKQEPNLGEGKKKQEKLSVFEGVNVEFDFKEQVEIKGDLQESHDTEVLNWVTTDAPKERDGEQAEIDAGEISAIQIATFGNIETFEGNTETQSESIVFTLEKPNVPDGMEKPGEEVTKQKRDTSDSIEEDIEKVKSLIAYTQSYNVFSADDKVDSSKIQKEHVTSKFRADTTVEGPTKDKKHEKRTRKKIAAERAESAESRFLNGFTKNEQNASLGMVNNAIDLVAAVELIVEEKPTRRQPGRNKTKQKILEDSSQKSDLEYIPESESSTSEELVVEEKPTRRRSGRNKTKQKIVETPQKSDLEYTVESEDSAAVHENVDIVKKIDSAATEEVVDEEKPTTKQSGRNQIKQKIVEETPQKSDLEYTPGSETPASDLLVVEEKPTRRQSEKNKTKPKIDKKQTPQKSDLKYTMESETSASDELVEEKPTRRQSGRNKTKQKIVEETPQKGDLEYTLESETSASDELVVEEKPTRRRSVRNKTKQKIIEETPQKCDLECSPESETSASDELVVEEKPTRRQSGKNKTKQKIVEETPAKSDLEYTPESEASATVHENVHIVKALIHFEEQTILYNTEDKANDNGKPDEVSVTRRQTRLGSTVKHGQKKLMTNLDVILVEIDDKKVSECKITTQTVENNEAAEKLETNNIMDKLMERSKSKAQERIQKKVNDSFEISLARPTELGIQHVEAIKKAETSYKSQEKSKTLLNRGKQKQATKKETSRKLKRPKRRIVSDSSDEEMVEAEPSSSLKNTGKTAGAAEIQEKIVTSTASFTKETPVIEDLGNEQRLEKSELMEDEKVSERKVTVRKQKRTSGNKEDKSPTKLAIKVKEGDILNKTSEIEKVEEISKITTRKQTRKSNKAPEVTNLIVAEYKAVTKSTELIKGKSEIDKEFSDKQNVIYDKTKRDRTVTAVETQCEVLENTSHSENDSNFGGTTNIQANVSVYSQSLEEINKDALELSPALNECFTQNVRDKVKQLKSKHTSNKNDMPVIDDMSNNLNVVSQKIASELPEKKITEKDIEVKGKAKEAGVKIDGEIIDLDNISDSESRSRSVKSVTFDTNTTFHSKGTFRKKRKFCDPDEPTYLNTITDETVITINSTKQPSIKDASRSKNVTQVEIVSSSNRANETLKKSANSILENQESQMTKKSTRQMKKYDTASDIFKVHNKSKASRLQRRCPNFNFEDMLQSWVDYVEVGKLKMEENLALVEIKKRKRVKGHKTSHPKKTSSRRKLPLNDSEFNSEKDDSVKRRSSRLSRNLSLNYSEIYSEEDEAAPKLEPVKQRRRRHVVRCELSSSDDSKSELDNATSVAAPKKDPPKQKSKSPTGTSNSKKIKVISNIVLKRKRSSTSAERGASPAKQIKILSGVKEQYIDGVKQPVMKRISLQGEKKYPQEIASSSVLHKSDEGAKRKSSDCIEKTVNEIEEIVDISLLDIDESKIDSNNFRKIKLLKSIKSQLKMFRKL